MTEIIIMAGTRVRFVVIYVLLLSQVSYGASKHGINKIIKQ